MCGFVGWINLNRDRAIDVPALQAMNRTLAHRGPDDEGYFVQDNVGIAHRRLSIIDTSSCGRQPLFNEDNTVLVVMNGEIYNYRPLRRLLEESGHAFSSDTDSEVAVHAYEEWGSGCVEHLDGMFSLAIYDTVGRKLILARDRFGKKPLYYTLQNGVFLFASELKAFFPNPHFRKSLDLLNASRYLAYEYVPAPYCIFDKCWKLPSASRMTVDTKNMTPTLTTEKYWEMSYEPKLGISSEDAAEELVRLLGQAVTKRLMSDVPLGVFLSGGIDSSTIVSLMADTLPARDINTFTIGFREDTYNESHYARAVSERFGTSHHEEILDSQEMMNLFPEIIKQLDEPFADPSIIPTYMLSRFSRKHITVALGGDGGDELMAGYDPFLAERFSWLIRHLPQWLVRKLCCAAKRIPSRGDNVDFAFKVRHFLGGFQPYTRNSVELRNSVWMGAFSPEMQKYLLMEECGSSDYKDIYSSTISHKEGKDSLETIDRMIDNFVNTYLHDDILVKTDRASMMNSLEVRSPFLDTELAEFVNRLPVHMKVNGFRRKALLKQAVCEKLPSEIVRRKKKGFGVPIAKWFRGPLRGMLNDIFSESRMNHHPFFNGQHVRQLVAEHTDGSRDYRKEIWALLVFELWRERYGL